MSETKAVMPIEHAFESWAFMFAAMGRLRRAAWRCHKYRLSFWSLCAQISATVLMKCLFKADKAGLSQFQKSAVAKKERKVDVYYRV